jgi:hypothetical protein
VSRRRSAFLLVLACALAGAAALAGSTTGCAQILGFTQDYYDAPDSSSVVPPFDGSVDEGDANSQPESTPPIEAGDSGDTGRAGDAEGGTFCQTLHPTAYFCDDFDEGQARAPFGWNIAQQMPGSSSLAIDTSQCESPPACLVAQTPVIMMSKVTVNTAVYEEQLPAGTQTFGGTMDLYMRVDSADAVGGFAVLAQIGLTDGAGAGHYYLQLVLISNGSAPLNCSLNEEFFSTDSSTGIPNGHPVSVTVPLTTWTHVTVSMSVPLAGGAGTATLGIDGQTTTVPLSVMVQNFSAELGVGVTYASTPSNGWQVTYDNVFFDSTSN